MAIITPVAKFMLYYNKITVTFLISGKNNLTGPRGMNLSPGMASQINTFVKLRSPVVEWISPGTES